MELQLTKGPLEMSDKIASPYADDHPSDLIGWHSDMSNEDYHSGPGVSKSSLDLIHKSIAHLQNRSLVRIETPAMVLGTAVHTAILEPHLWPDGYLRGPDADRRAKEWKEAQEEADRYGLILMKRDDFDKVDMMAASVASHPNPIIQLITEGRELRRVPCSESTHRREHLLSVGRTTTYQNKK